MDNFKIDVFGEGRKNLENALAICFDINAPGETAKSYAVTRENGLVLRWTDPGKTGAVELAFPHRLADAVGVVWGWLHSEAAQAWAGESPDCDGSVILGWRVFTTGEWGHVGEDRYAICAVRPIWSLHGK